VAKSKTTLFVAMLQGEFRRECEVGREPGVAHVLEGSVRTAGNRIRVTARLIKADEGGTRDSRQVMLLNPLHRDPRWQPFLERLGASDAQLENIRLEVKPPH